MRRPGMLHAEPPNMCQQFLIIPKTIIVTGAKRFVIFIMTDRFCLYDLASRPTNNTLRGYINIRLEVRAYLSFFFLGHFFSFFFCLSAPPAKKIIPRYLPDSWVDVQFTWRNPVRESENRR